MFAFSFHLCNMMWGGFGWVHISKKEGSISISRSNGSDIEDTDMASSSVVCVATVHTKGVVCDPTVRVCFRRRWVYKDNVRIVTATAHMCIYSSNT